MAVLPFMSSYGSMRRHGAHGQPLWMLLRRPQSATSGACKPTMGSTLTTSSQRTTVAGGTVTLLSPPPRYAV